MQGMESMSRSMNKMVTRYKLKRQKDGGDSLPPQKLSKSPVKGKGSQIVKSKKNYNSSPKNSSKKKSKVNTINEYYPNKLKRSNYTKKIVLRPKNQLKVIAKASKRKLAMPHKEMQSSVAPLNPILESSSEMSMGDMIRAFEETHELDDEDLMEILTCPSPVWWEDPPDDTYVEGPILKKILEVGTGFKPKCQKENQTLTAQPAEESKYEVNIQNKDTNFKNKRSKLELLLNNLKDKANSEKNDNNKVPSDKIGNNIVNNGKNNNNNKHNTEMNDNNIVNCENNANNKVNSENNDNSKVISEKSDNNKVNGEIIDNNKINNENNDNNKIDNEKNDNNKVNSEKNNYDKVVSELHNKKLDIDSSEVVYIKAEEVYVINNNKEPLIVKNKVEKEKKLPTISISRRSILKRSNMVEKSVNNFIGMIKIKNPVQINKDLEKMSIVNNISESINKIEDSCKNGKSPPKETTNNEVDEQVGKVHDEKEDEIIDETVLSDTTDLSEISMNEEFLKDLENIEIPVADFSNQDTHASNSGNSENEASVTNISSKENDQDSTSEIEACKSVRKYKRLAKKLAPYKNEEALDHHNNKARSKKSNDKPTRCRNIDNLENKTVKKIKIYKGAKNKNDNNKDNKEESESLISTSSIDYVQTDTSPVTVLEEESFNSYEFDLEFENAILGLESTVLVPRKIKKRVLNKKVLNNDVEQPKNDNKVDTNESATVKQISKKRKIKNVQEDIIDAPVNNWKEWKIDGCLRGKKRRQKIKIDNKSKIETAEEDIFQVEPEPEVIVEIKTGQNETKVDKEAVDVSQRGRIRRKKVLFTHDKYEKIPKKKEKTDSKCQRKHEYKGDIVETVLNDMQHKYYCNKRHDSKFVKKYENLKIKHKKQNVDDIAKDEKINEPNEKSNVRQFVNKTKIRKLNRDQIDSISESEVKFINESDLEKDITEINNITSADSNHESSKSKENVADVDNLGLDKNQSTKDYQIDIDLNNRSINEINEMDKADENLEQYKNDSPTKISEETDVALDLNNKIISESVLNTKSKRLETSHSDKEVINSEDVDTITVFKIIPNDFE